VLLFARGKNKSVPSGEDPCCKEQEEKKKKRAAVPEGEGGRADGPCLPVGNSSGERSPLKGGEGGKGKSQRGAE